MHRPHSAKAPAVNLVMHRVRRLAGGGAVAVLLSSGCSASSGSQAASEAPADSGTFTATGVLTLTLPLVSDSIEGNLDLCARQAPVQPGHQITIEDQRGEIVGFGQLEPFEFDTGDGTCRMSWTANDVPMSKGVYALVISDGLRPVQFRQGEAEIGLTTRLPDPQVP